MPSSLEIALLMLVLLLTTERVVVISMRAAQWLRSLKRNGDPHALVTSSNMTAKFEEHESWGQEAIARMFGQLKEITTADSNRLYLEFREMKGQLGKLNDKVTELIILQKRSSRMES